eukprot:TCONS_00003703-protein
MQIYGAISKKLTEVQEKKIKKDIAHLLVDQGKYFCPLKYLNYDCPHRCHRHCYLNYDCPHRHCALVLYLSKSGGSRGEHTFRSSMQIYGTISKKLTEVQEKKIKKDIAHLLVDQGKYFCPLKYLNYDCPHRFHRHCYLNYDCPHRCHRHCYLNYDCPHRCHRHYIHHHCHGGHEFALLDELHDEHVHSWQSVLILMVFVSLSMLLVYPVVNHPRSITILPALRTLVDQTKIEIKITKENNKENNKLKIHRKTNITQYIKSWTGDCPFPNYASKLVNESWFPIFLDTLRKVDLKPTKNKRTTLHCTRYVNLTP